MTNKESLSNYIKNSNAENVWMILDYLLHDYGRQFNSTPSAVIEWLNEDAIVPKICAECSDFDQENGCCQIDKYYKNISGRFQMCPIF